MVNEFGKKIKMLREEKGLSQQQLAVALGVSPATIAEWERKIYKRFRLRN